ncbi:MAG TPA: DHA2 family efflux MFS transporter permease subunit [Galbitalea sp.]|nr:DHA2 family efflux MFS transporter permease subunit [Galbitalea sp.]
MAGVVVFGAVMGMLDTSLVNIGLRTIGNDLHAGLDAVQWVASAYLLALAVALPICSWLGRRVGVARLWLGALVAFTIVSALCALAPDVGVLIALRVLQGLAAGFLIPAGQTLLGQAAGPKRMGRVMGIVGIAVVAAPAVGPTIGGLLLAHLSWQWLFLINVPLGVVALVLGLRVLTKTAGSGHDRVDVIGLLLAGAGFSAVVYGVGNIADAASVGPLLVWLPIVGGVIAIVAFVLRALRQSKPLLDVRMFGNRVFAAANGASFFAGAAMFGVSVLLPLYFQVVHGEGLVNSGLLLISYGLGGVVAFPLGGRLTDRVGGGVVAVVGNLVAAAVWAAFSLLDAHTNMLLLQPLLFIGGLAAGFVIMPLASAAYAAVRQDQVPDAAAFVNILQRVGGAVAVALVAVILSGATASTAVNYQFAFAAIAVSSVVAALASAVLWRHERRERRR